MNQEKLFYFKGLLEGQLHTLVEEAERACVDMRQENKGDFPDPTDRAALEADRNFILRIKDRERKLIQKVKEALQRIEDGTFGTCEVCGKAISEKRLVARPVTTLCIQCKTEGEVQEQKARLRGTKSGNSYPF